MYKLYIIVYILKCIHYACIIPTCIDFNTIPAFLHIQMQEEKRFL